MLDQPSCRLYLISPPEFEVSEIAPALGAALKAGDIACFLLDLAQAGDDDLAAAARALLPVCHDHEVPLLIRNRPEIAVISGADGCEAEIAAVAEVRARLGGGGIVGSGAAPSRHAALEAAENCADYVSFDMTQADIPDIAAWWSDLMEVPCVALVSPTLEACAEAARAGLDYVAVSTLVWRHPDGPAAGVVAANEAIETGKAT